MAQLRRTLPPTVERRRPVDLDGPESCWRQAGDGGQVQRWTAEGWRPHPAYVELCDMAGEDVQHRSLTLLYGALTLETIPDVLRDLEERQ